MFTSGNSSDERHIVIIGGGIIGASILYYLAQNRQDGVRLSLIEESKSIAPAASGKSGGFLAEDWHGPDTADLARLSYRLHRELAKEGGGEQKWGYRNVDTLSIHFDEGKSLQKAPKGLDWVEGKHIVSHSNMGGGGTTAQATPLPLTEYLVARAQQLGGSEHVQVLCSSRAQHIKFTPQGHCQALMIQNKQTGQEQEIPATDVVIAAGPWTGKLVKSLLKTDNVPLPKFVSKASRIGGSRAHSIVVEAPQPTSAHCLFTDMHYGKRQAGAPEVYCRGDGTVYACGGSDNVPLPSSADEVHYDEAQTARLVEQVAHLSPSHLSPSAGARIAREQACYLPVASGGPIISYDERTGLGVAAGHSCWGITLSLGTGLVMRELLLGEELSADVRHLQ